MTVAARPIHWDTWALQEEADRRFRRLVWRILLPLLVIGLIIPYVRMAERERAAAEETARYAELLKPPPPPPKKEEPKPEPEKAPEKPQLSKEQKVAKAREKATKMMAQFDQLADLREKDLPKIDNPMSASVITSKSGTGNPSFASSATAGSGGIGEIGVVEHGAARTGLGSRSGTAVRSNIGGRGEGMGKIVKGRTLEEIQLVFDRTKGAFYTMYVREQRQRPDMAGKVTVRLTIAPNGSVKSCRVISSELSHPEFEKKVVARVLLMDFGPKDVGDFTIDYPILFFPS
jgi:protein TonB